MRGGNVGKKDKKPSGNEKSLLYRLWLRTVGDNGKPVDAPEEPVTPTRPVITLDLSQNYLNILWQKYHNIEPEPTAPEPAEIPPAKENGEPVADKKEPPKKALPLFDAFELVPILEEGTALERDMKKFHELIERTAEHRVLAETPPEKPLCLTKISSDLTCAWLFFFAPCVGEEKLTAEEISELLTAKSILYGVDEERVSALGETPEYFKVIPIAKGIAAKHGDNGEIIKCIELDDLSSKRKDINNEEESDINALYPVNFKVIHKGDVLCEIVKPTDGEDGISVKGAKIVGRAGRPAELPRGANVELSQDATKLLASENGRVTFVGGKFVVERALVIREDVDISTGDIDFDGNVLIRGDVRGGFTVVASGDVIIEGRVENALVKAGGNITVKRGMNGNNEGRLEAKGEVRSKYLENCSVSATGNVYSENIICSDVMSDDSILLEGGKGVIIGGSCTAPKTIRAQRIGTESYRVTLIVCGSTSNMLQKYMQAQNAARDSQQQLEELERETAYLDKFSKSLTGERKALYNKMKLQQSIMRVQVQQQLDALEAMHDQLEDVEQGRIICDTVYPATKIVMGKSTLTIESIWHNCTIYCKNSQIEIST